MAFNVGIFQFILWQIGIMVVLFGGLGSWLTLLNNTRARRQDDIMKRLIEYKNEAEKSLTYYKSENEKVHEMLSRDLTGMVVQVRALQRDISKNYVSWDHFRDLDHRLNSRFDRLEVKLDNQIKRSNQKE